MRLHFDPRTPYITVKEFLWDVLGDPHMVLYKEVMTAPQSIGEVAGRWVGMPIVIFFHFVCIVAALLVGAIPTLLIGFLFSIKFKTA